MSALLRRDHDPNVWLADRRPVLTALLPSDSPGEVAAPFEVTDGWRFERFERNGEYCGLPYLRISRLGEAFEAPVSRFAWIRFGEVQP